MKKQAQIQFDYLKNLYQNYPLEMAISELIWNAIDAEAKEVSIIFKKDSSEKITSIEIRDNGHGIQKGDAEKLFCHIGHLEENHRTSENGIRTMHGTKGLGRLYAFRLGRKVTWNIKFSENGNIKSYDILTSSENIDEVEIGELNDTANGQECGVNIIISELNQDCQSLLSSELQSELTRTFSLHRQILNQSGSDSLEIKVDGTSIFEKIKREGFEEFDLQSIENNGKNYDLSLSIIEFSELQEGKLYLCDGEGFPLDSIQLGIQSNEYHFTAFLKSEYFTKQLMENREKINYIDGKTQVAIELASEKIRSIIRDRGLKSSESVIQQWKSEEIYPFRDDLNLSEAKQIEKRLFDSLALQVNSVHPKFMNGDKESMKLQLQLIRNAIEFTPSYQSNSLYEVLKLDPGNQCLLASILENTPLVELIQATKKFTDRIKFLEGLELILFDERVKNEVKERSQLHKIIAKNAWIFGEKFEVLISDQSLTELLKKHARKLSDEIRIDEEVLTPDGKRGIIDLMLSRTIQSPASPGREHLIIELKQPSKVLDQGAKVQIENYAVAVATDERFRDTDTNWVFWVISNKMDERVRASANQTDRPFGLIHSQVDPNIKIWVKTWGQLLNECKSRLYVNSGGLNYHPETGAIVSYLEENYEEFLPSLSSLKEE